MPLRVVDSITERGQADPGRLAVSGPHGDGIISHPNAAAAILGVPVDPSCRAAVDPLQNDPRSPP